MATIDDKTRIPLFAVLCALPFLIGGVAWLTSVDAKASQAAEKASQAREEIAGIRALSIDIRERQIRMEQMVQDLTDKRGKK